MSILNLGNYSFGAPQGPFHSIYSKQKQQASVTTLPTVSLVPPSPPPGLLCSRCLGGQEGRPSTADLQLIPVDAAADDSHFC